MVPCVGVQSNSELNEVLLTQNGCDEVQWLVKIKTASNGDVIYEAWAQPRTAAPGQEQPKTVLTKPKILTVAIEWLRVEERRNTPTRYVLSAAMYQRLLDAVK